MDTNFYFETLIIYRLKQIIIMYSKQYQAKVASVRSVCGLKTLLAELHSKSLSATFIKQIFLCIFFIMRDKTGEGNFTTKTYFEFALKS